MKKMIRILLSIVFCLTICLNTAFASTDINWKLLEQQAFENQTSVLLPESITKSRAFNSLERGRYIGSSCVEISNEGYGKIGIYADTLAHVAVKKIQMKIFLDRWDEESSSWVQVKSFTFTYNASNDETLNAVSESFTVDDQPTGYRYRLRGLHGVWTFDGELETHGTMTDGVLIKSGPA